MSFSVYKILDSGTKDEQFSVVLSGRLYDFRTQVNYITGVPSLDISYNGRQLISGVMMSKGSVAMNQSYGIAAEIENGHIYVAIKENTPDNR